ncbi:Peptidyl-prolyl cis-trans isomerase [Meloidogyne graminicola]|uniref:Peptidyl-prolyl cis-trans isomerase n=1 Tax=Meloidogyne graminicola TaxID=189291 RepID=A0A8S9ZZ25_9BILA|nr:Peptidyl-prolyl cis-trans isomerase [Meloidogyne graminicola]
MSVLIETTIGDLVIDLFIKERPNASKNFLKLCKTKYYNLCQFFTIEPNYIAQTGDPTNTGRGGESIFGTLFGEQANYFDMELVPKLRHTRRGLVSMVNNGEGLIGSQFFITLADELDFLDGKHCIFGQVAEGLETVTKLNEELVNEENKPYRDIRIAHTIILDDPFEDPPRLKIPRRSPSPTTDLIKLDNQIALDERVDEDEGKTAEEVKLELEQKEMKEHAQILEMVGDLHYAEERPPDNVLFVCKLNPATSDEDLEIIFSRFGTILSCEVIRDRRTKSSLQYAFIEFETPEQCEKAFMKMDNVLIDDRRIHVDFSQSVAKNYQWNRKVTKSDEQKGSQYSSKDIPSRSDHSSRDRHQDENKDKRRKREDEEYERNDRIKMSKRSNNERDKHSTSDYHRHHRYYHEEERQTIYVRSRSRERRRHNNHRESDYIREHRRH